LGDFCHHSIIVCGQEQSIYNAHAKAKYIFDDLVSNVIESSNGYYSFFIAPDGSKEGWPRSNDLNLARNEFIEYLKKDGLIDWVEVQFANELGEDKMLRSCNNV
jgi:hypothetical protein